MRFSSSYPPKFSTYNTSQNTQPCFRTLRGGWNCFLRILFQNLMLHTQQTTSKTQLSYRKTLHPQMSASPYRTF